MARITVASNKEIARPGKTTFWVIHDDKGSKFQLWDRKYWDVLQPGNVVDIEVDFRGDFVNIKEATLIEGQPQPNNQADMVTSTAPFMPSTFDAEPSLRAQAILAATNGGLTGDKAVVMAEHYFQYVIKGANYAAGCWQRIKRKEGGETSLPSPDSITTMEQVYEQAKILWGIDDKEVARQLGYDHSEDVIQWDTETPKDVWNQLLEIYAEPKQGSF